MGGSAPSMNPVCWFEIPVNDPERAKKFYEELLGISMTRQNMPGYEMVWFPADGKLPNVGGALLKGMGYTPAAGGTVVYFSTPDIDAALGRAESLGARVILPKKDIGEHGCIAWVEDSEGNPIGLHMARA